MRTLACRAYWTALEGRAGVVHLNFALREPLTLDAELPPDASARAEGRPYVSRPPRAAAAPAQLQTLRELAARAQRGVVIAGRSERDRSLAASVTAFAEAAGWPLLADPLSGSRAGAAAIAHYDALLRDPRFATEFAPDLVLRVGDLPVSKPLRTWLAGLDRVPQVALDPDGAWQDPAAVLSHSLALDPGVALEQLTETLRTSAAAPAAAHDWLASWRTADELAAEAILRALGDQQLSEPAVAVELGVLLPAEATLFVASSMPVRDIETFWPVRPDAPRVLCNRGANGIDGIVSAAFGAAAEGRGPVVLLIGDVALAHDLGGLLAASRLALKLTIVLLDNDGGGIFDFLALSGASMALAPDPSAAGTGGDGADVFTRHIATPSGLDFKHAAALYGLEHLTVETVPGFREALERTIAPQAAATIIHVHTNRAANVELHRRLWSCVADSLRL
jgi:2-succinyl-5-enolpyruvyl-6-hydroxy-3-cyclohexene-1-carboxylate synthase